MMDWLLALGPKPPGRIITAGRIARMCGEEAGAHTDESKKRHSNPYPKKSSPKHPLLMERLTSEARRPSRLAQGLCNPRWWQKLVPGGLLGSKRRCVRHNDDEGCWRLEFWSHA